MLRCNEDKTRKLRFPLGAGDVLIMSGATQASAAVMAHSLGLIHPLHQDLNPILSGVSDVMGVLRR